ncbi:MAG: hypothetical protein ACK5B9_13965 [Flavobacteriia bacterium]|jgi:magnesium-transporting ATPase (P-type)
MTALKWTWKIIWRCIFIPVIFTFVVMIVSMFFINDMNQTSESSKAIDQNYGTSYQHYKNVADENPNFKNKYNQYNSSGDRKYVPKHVEMEDDDFDTTGVIATIALFSSFIVMVIYTISDFRDYRKQQKLTS